VTHVSSGSKHATATTKEGKLYTWGSNKHSQQGGVSDDDHVKVPTELPFSQTVVDVRCGYYHTLALTEDGTVFSWGKNDSGCCGVGHNNNVATPTAVTLPSKAAQIFSGGYHSGALTTEGDLYLWGFNYSGELGAGHKENRNTPQKVPIDFEISQVILGSYHAIVLTKDGDVYSWGTNHQYGQLGLGRIGNDYPTPQKVSSLKNIVRLAAGQSHVLAFTASGDIYGWGSNDGGQLGLGNRTNQGAPQKLHFPFTPKKL
jgi:alpha-tubulin suppressor-like RCC1 family protein